MSVPTPNNINDPESIDRIIKNVQSRLTANLVWLEACFGKAYKVKDIGKDSAGSANSLFNQSTYYPEEYAGDNEYQRVTPEDTYKSMCYFIAGPNEFPEFANNRYNYVENDVSIVFWVDLDKIDSALNSNYRFTQKLIKEVEYVMTHKLNGVGAVFTLDSISEDFKDIYEGFNLKEESNQPIKAPKAGFIVKGKLKHKEGCVIPPPQSACLDGVVEILRSDNSVIFIQSVGSGQMEQYNVANSAVNLTNSDATYALNVSVLADSSKNEVLPDINVTDSDGSVSTFPSVKDVVCTPSQPATNEIYDTDSNLLYTVNIPSGDTLATIIQNGTISINGVNTYSTLAQSVKNIGVINSALAAVGTVVGDNVEIADSTAVQKDTNGVVLSTTQIVAEGSEDITAPDATSTPTDSAGTILYTDLIQSGSTFARAISDSIISINSNNTYSVLAQQTQNINLLDPDGNTIEVDSVSGNNLNIFLYWFQIAVLLFRNRLIAEGATFETPEDCTSNIIDIGETTYNDASIVITPNAYKDGKLPVIKPNDGSADLDVTRGSLTTAFNKDNELVTLAGLDTPMITYVDGRTLIRVLNEATNINPFSQDLNEMAGASRITTTDFGSGGFGNLPYQEFEKVSLGNVLNAVISTTEKASYRFYVRNISDKITPRIIGLNGGSQSYIEIDNNYNVTLRATGSIFTVEDTGYNGWHEVTLFCETAIGEDLFYYLDPSNMNLGDTAEICQMDVQEDWNINAHIITSGATETRFEDVITTTPPAGTTKITEFFHDGTTNEITTIPATYQMSKGLIERVIFE